MRPHVVKSVEDAATGALRETVAKEVGRIDVKPEALELVKNAMVGGQPRGHGPDRRSGAPNTSSAGKTGTAQVIGIKQNEKYDASKIAERLRDHSLFVAFAPVDKPKIALALIVENGGFGAQAAAPIARKVFDYYLLGKLPKDQDLPFPDRQDEEEMRDVPESIEPELAPGEAASPAAPDPSACRGSPRRRRSLPRRPRSSPPLRQGRRQAAARGAPRRGRVPRELAAPPAEAAPRRKPPPASPKKPAAPPDAPRPVASSEPAHRRRPPLPPTRRHGAPSASRRRRQQAGRAGHQAGRQAGRPRSRRTKERRCDERPLLPRAAAPPRLRLRPDAAARRCC